MSLRKGNYSFSGMSLTSMAPEKTSAIESLSSPSNITELRRFLGMANQMGKFSPNLAQVTQPLRELLIKTALGNGVVLKKKPLLRLKPSFANLQCLPSIPQMHQPNFRQMHHHMGWGQYCYREVMGNGNLWHMHPVYVRYCKTVRTY